MTSLHQKSDTTLKKIFLATQKCTKTYILTIYHNNLIIVTFKFGITHSNLWPILQRIFISDI